MATHKSLLLPINPLIPIHITFIHQHQTTIHTTNTNIEPYPRLLFSTASPFFLVHNTKVTICLTFLSSTTAAPVSHVFHAHIRHRRPLSLQQLSKPKIPKLIWDNC
ncbi:hypothetical protein RND81_03G048100 [Saponaria officinalis]|uniref:Uncharacterized protein n=1 Tax=Saponaria officinalis TaxID=3572 RepID=A0AAW1M3N7_SAPOF